MFGQNNGQSWGSDYSKQLTQTQDFSNLSNEFDRLQKPVQSHPLPSHIIKKNLKFNLALIAITLLITITLGISLIMPWYHITYITNDSNKTEYRYSFTNVELENYGKTKSMSWDDLNSTENQRNLYKATMVLTIISLIMGLMFLICGIRIILGKNKKIALLFGVLILIFCWLSSIIFMGMHPSVLKMDNEELTGNGPWDSFIGSEIEYSYKERLNIPFDWNTLELQWGPNIGWILTIVSAILSVFGLILVIKYPPPEKIDYYKLQQKLPQLSQPIQQKYCSSCGQSLKYFQQNNRYYCDYCKKYE